MLHGYNTSSSKVNVALRNSLLSISILLEAQPFTDKRSLFDQYIGYSLLFLSPSAIRVAEVAAGNYTTIVLFGSSGLGISTESPLFEQDMLNAKTANSVKYRLKIFILHSYCFVFIKVSVLCCNLGSR